MQDPALAALCDAIREKENWFIKILDPNRDLGLKWAKEANMVSTGQSKKNLASNQRLDAALR